MIKLENVSKSYDQVIIKDFSFTFSESCRYCIMGNSGAGKTTLLNMIAGLTPADSGTVFVGGEVSFVFQEDRLVESFDALTNISIATGKDRNYIIEKATSILEEDSLTKSCYKLSGGQKRRVAIARAILRDSDILLMDEPFTGLDQKTKETCCSFITDNLNGRLLIAVTHSAEDAKLLGAEIINIKGE